MLRPGAFTGPTLHVWQQGCAVSPPDSATLYESYGRELDALLELVLAGDLVSDRAVVERRVVRAVGALVWLQQRHRVDDRGQCSICWTRPHAWWWPWPRRSFCTVQTALSFCLHQPDRFVLPTLADQSRPVVAQGTP